MRALRDAERNAFANEPSVAGDRREPNATSERSCERESGETNRSVAEASRRASSEYGRAFSEAKGSPHLQEANPGERESVAVK